MKTFGIQIEDGSKTISQFVLNQNLSFIELYDWQHRAIDYFFSHSYRVIYECATGVGKTFMAIQLIKKIWNIDPDAQVLVVVPKNVILETGWYKELYENGISLKDIGVYYGFAKEYGKGH